MKKDDPTEFKIGERYSVGFTVDIYNPAEEQYRNMLHLVAYDIRDPKRLRKVAKVCEDFGIRVEYSVFECDLSEEQFKSLWDCLLREIDPGKDTILAYKICGSCVTRIVSLGIPTRPERKLVYIL
jgi:CRISPR-associated protein Cas2